MDTNKSDSQSVACMLPPEVDKYPPLAQSPPQQEEQEKLADWVELLKNMADVRQEVLTKVSEHGASHTHEHLAAAAKKLTEHTL